FNFSNLMWHFLFFYVYRNIKCNILIPRITDTLHREVHSGCNPEERHKHYRITTFFLKNVKLSILHLIPYGFPCKTAFYALYGTLSFSDPKIQLITVGHYLKFLYFQRLSIIELKILVQRDSYVL